MLRWPSDLFRATFRVTRNFRIVTNDCIIDPRLSPSYTTEAYLEVQLETRQVAVNLLSYTPPPDQCLFNGRPTWPTPVDHKGLGDIVRPIGFAHRPGHVPQTHTLTTSACPWMDMLTASNSSLSSRSHLIAFKSIDYFTSTHHFQIDLISSLSNQSHLIAFKSIDYFTSTHHFQINQ
ncbi:hypothetical protein CROQUDRAFT_94585 [Cronartium quercuum f. sp. fusiforme G11]|uniref:Uncharacterized protein n=1 Tax=Cronartium quercuum f. sp. fusiforme G11 TaxID=708437 RepID=A0A9P6NEX5_9BASI|nr:hypothetical protein CROQUDRAFT_94585 [Cronartium quercuum f. sp. fusiforme G11]